MAPVVAVAVAAAVTDRHFQTAPPEQEALSELTALGAMRAFMAVAVEDLLP